MGQCEIKEYSFCEFSAVADKLLPAFSSLKRLPENAKTVICFLFPYKVENKRPFNISRYAAVPDYHTVCGEKLKTVAEKLKNAFPDNKFEPFIDNSPIPEVYAASTAGLGLVGDHGLLITRRYGTFAFIGEIVTDLEVPCYSEYMECTHCGRCKAACPATLCKENCLSKLSQKKGELTEEEAVKIKENKIVWGCDICAESCPFNKYAQLTYIDEFTYGYRDRYTPGEDTKNRPYKWRGDSVIERNYRLNQS